MSAVPSATLPETVSSRYGLAWNPNPPIRVPQLVSFAVAAGVYTILSWLGVIALPIGIVGVSSLFVAIGFGVPFALWFGGWGLVIGFIGTFLGSGLLSGVPLVLSIPFGFTDWIQFGVPLIAYRTLARRIGLDPLGKDVYTRRGIVFFVGTMLVSNLLGALYGITVLYAGGLVPPDAFVPGVVGWWVGNVIVTVIIAPALMRTVGPIVERYGLTCHGLVS